MDFVAGRVAKRSGQGQSWANQWFFMMIPLGLVGYVDCWGSQMGIANADGIRLRYR